MIERVLRRLLGRYVERFVRQALQARDDELGWRVLSGSGRQETPWHTRRRELEAWRSNPLARRLVTIGTDYCLGETGIQVGSDIAAVDRWVKDFWGHAENHMGLRLREWSDELGPQPRVCRATAGWQPQGSVGWLPWPGVNLHHWLDENQ